MKECEFCSEEFEGDEDLKIHWLEEHEDELNSHQKEKAEKAKKDREEREKIRKENRKQRLYQGVGGAVALVVLMVLGSQLIPSGGSTAITTQGEPMLGDANASVTVVEFGDFECPACRTFEQSAFSQLKSNYIDTGEVKFYWKDYPLQQIHRWARTGAETMECVYRQNETAFWDVKSTLFQNQRSLTIQNAQEEIIGWASDEGVNETEVRSCIDSGDPGSEVRSDITEGRQNGVSGTPTIYVNGKQLSSFDYNTVQQAIEEELEN